jgi:hypothetical protein
VNPKPFVLDLAAIGRASWPHRRWLFQGAVLGVLRFGLRVSLSFLIGHYLTTLGGLLAFRYMPLGRWWKWPKTSQRVIWAWEEMVEALLAQFTEEESHHAIRRAILRGQSPVQLVRWGSLTTDPAVRRILFFELASRGFTATFNLELDRMRTLGMRDAILVFDSDDQAAINEMRAHVNAANQRPAAGSQLQ